MSLDAFPRYTLFDPLVPVYRVTDGRRPTIHRFFDSNPISPSGRYLALTEFPFDDRLPQPGDKASVVVTDLATGGEVYRRATAAWDTQVGAQVQWGAGDHALHFNLMDETRWRPFGVAVDIMSDTERALEGTIYHVSPDGRFSLSPDLIKITLAQAGYGVHVPRELIARNRGAPEDDGIFITDLATGRSRLLISLRMLLKAIGPLFAYGDHTVGEWLSFHTKWNHDGRRIMFIMRWFSSNLRRRRSQNWLITLSPDGSDIRVAIPPDVWGDGHHPNWYPTSDDIVMNLPSRQDLMGRLLRLIGKVGRRTGIPVGGHGIPLHFRAFHHDGSGLVSLSQEKGSGHPTIHPKGKHLLSDAYLSEPVAFGDGSVPIRLIELASGRSRVAVRIDTRPRFAGAHQELRIDPHPVWDRDGRHLVFNGSVDGVRSVFIADFAGIFA